MAGTDSQFTFSFEEFSAWYDSLSRQKLDPAAKQLLRLVNQLLDETLDEFRRRRVRVIQPRVKSPIRLWNKISTERYRERIHQLDDVAREIDDLVGLRIVCNNVSDISSIQEILGAIPSTDETDVSLSLLVEPESERMYHLKPKESGYRAYHINLWTPVTGIGGMERVRAELQVRTLLQDGWGELTHEDTYKPGAQLPPLAEKLARRMADLLSTVDDLAEDIRRELDQSVQNSLGTPTAEKEPKRQSDTASSPMDTGLPEETLVLAVREIVNGLDRPTPLASIAHALQRQFGAEISNGWGGFESFKALLLHASPDLTLLEQGPSYLLPPGTTMDAATRSTVGGDERLPQLVRALKASERGLPTVFGEQMQDLMAALELTLREDVWLELRIDQGQMQLGIREVNELTRYARDQMAKSGRIVSRKDIDYFLKGLLWSRELRPGLSIEDAQLILAARLFNKAAAGGAYETSLEDQRALLVWFQGSTPTGADGEGPVRQPPDR